MFVALLALTTTHAFVIEPRPPGTSRHWDLLTPEVHLSPDAAIPVSTNIVNPATRAVRFFIASDAYSATNRLAELNAVRAAFALWQAAPSASVRFEDAGLAPPGVDINETDHTNVVFWAKDGAWVAGGTLNIGFALGYTVYATQADVLTDADIVLNGAYDWFTDYNHPPPGETAYFVEATVAHEVGHLVGLEHSPLGGALMFYHALPGLSTVNGLASDDLLGVQYLYPDNGLLNGRGRLAGRVTLEGRSVLGAALTAEDGAGNALAGTLSRADGSYDLPALPPGRYAVRASPLDSPAASFAMLRGRDIYPAYAGAETAFLPTANAAAEVRAGEVVQLDFAVTGGAPPFRITHLRRPLMNQVGVNAPVSVRAGQSNLVLGVYGPSLPTDGATLTASGDGLTLTPLSASSQLFGLNLLAVRVSVSPGATPGLRSFTVSKGPDLAYANGCLVVQPHFPDFNFDGLDDTFQRRFFPLWTAAEAGPAADPDADGFDNRYEYLAATNPAAADSTPRLELESVTQTVQGSTIAWRSVSGARYQVWARDAFSPTTPWQAAGPALTATNELAAFFDSAGVNAIRFYRVELLR